MKVSVDQSLCIGSGNCIVLAPAVFDQNEDGLVEVLDHEPPSVETDAVTNAVARCPMGVIAVA